MTIESLINKNIFEVIHESSHLDKVITKPFCCDLLSIAMSKAQANSIWVTVMGNVNTLAVAILADVACIVLAEGACLDTVALSKAKEQDICVLRSLMPIFDTALIIYNCIHDET